MMKILALIALLAFASHADLSWSSWNNFASTNQFYVQGLTASLPSVPSGFTRYSDTNTPQTTYSTRANQYRYKKSTSYGICNVYCGLRSFLTTDANGNLVCKRDQDANFWGGSIYPTYCIPDADKTNACTEATQFYGSVGQCNMAIYSSISGL